MRRALAIIATPALLVAGEAWAQITPGLRAPADVAMAVRHGLQYGCFFAVSGRPSAGLNIDFSSAGPSLHPPGDVPERLESLTNAKTNIAVLDAPQGAAWILFDSGSRRCTVVPSPVDVAGVEKVAGEVFSSRGGWRPVDSKPGTFEHKIDGEPLIHGWYQPATGDQPQMFIMEPKQ